MSHPAFAVEEAVPRLSSVDRVIRKFDSAKALVNGIAVISCPLALILLLWSDLVEEVVPYEVLATTLVVQD